ncbi:trehalase isoform X2 [Penaeus vannamei]|uniref:trehalase isoform X2 n=1 Tax=Penaeus vannamei TaxID=6689 RepID=UPI00387FADD1
MKVAMERRRAWSWQGTQAAAVMMLALLAGAARSQRLPPPCDSEIYCHGNLLHTVQMARLFNDSKHFVDMSLKASPNDTLRAFQDLMNETGNKPSKEQVTAFVSENFNEPGSEFVKWTPPDWNPSPEFLDKVVDPELEQWGRKLNELWKDLGRKISDDVEQNPDKYSQIFVPNPVIVPGGRFREFYYWDSYWTIDGLLLTGMEETVKGMLENFIQMVNDYGMVPNGGRVYYTRRSQPPYLIPMVKLYMDQTNDLQFLRTHIDQLVEEFEFWENERSVEVQGRSGRSYKVAQYRAEVGEPRPESYREDYELAHTLKSDEAKEQLYVELKSGAESGWDYSTRWIINNNTNKVGVFMIALYFVCPFLLHGKYSLLIVMLLALGLWEMSSTPTDVGTLQDLKVTSIAPVDLNSLLCSNALTLAQFYRKLGNYTLERKFSNLADEKNTTMAELFWDSTDGTWYDVDINTQQKRRYFYLSNIHPIWSGCYGQEDSRAHTIDQVISYLKKIKVLNHVGGVPTSLVESGQQWDFPNAWAPLQHLVIMGLYNARSIHHEAENLSLSLAEKWIRTNWQGYQQSKPNAMFEKYNVSIIGLPGGGGEYDVQLGFGWTNGVALRLLETFSDRLTATTGGSSHPKAASFGLIILIALLPLQTFVYTFP